MTHPQPGHDEPLRSWHTLEVADAFERLQSSPQGLDAADAAARRARFGRNVLPGRTPPSLALIVVHQFLSPLIYILLAAAAVAIALGDVADAGFIVAVVLLNASLGAYQEWRAEQSASALQRLLTVRARVRRASR